MWSAGLTTVQVEHDAHVLSTANGNIPHNSLIRSRKTGLLAANELMALAIG